MKTEGKALALVCALSLALMALMIVPGLLLQPTIVKADINEICSGIAGDNCIRCPSSNGYGCFNVNGWPPGYKYGMCMQQSGQTCSASQYWCGVMMRCNPPKQMSNNCTTLAICI